MATNFSHIRLPPPPAPSHPSRPGSNTLRRASHHRRTFSASQLPPPPSEAPDDLHPLRQHPVDCARPDSAAVRDDQADPDEFEDILLGPTPAITDRPVSYRPVPSGHANQPGAAQKPHDPRIASSTVAPPESNGHRRSQTTASFFESYKLPDRGRATQRSKNPKFLSGWFDGKSAPISLGLLPSPTRERRRSTSDDEGDYSSGSETGSDFQTDSESESEEESDDDLSSSEEESDEEDSASEAENEPPRRQRRPLSMFARAKTAGPSPPQIQRNNTSKFAWFTRATTSETSPVASSPTKQPVPSSPPSMKTDEDLLNLSIHHALFPTGNPDPLDPSAFHDLVSTATKLASRLQEAYVAAHQQRVEAQAEASARAEERDEAETRARALRAQLEEMGKRTEEKEREILRVKKLAEEEREARVRSLRIVSGQCEEGDEEYEEDVEEPDAEDALLSPREGEVLSDSGFESGSDHQGQDVPPAPAPRPRKLQKAPTSGAMDGTDKKRPKPVPRASTFERVVKGMPAHRREEARQAQLRLKTKEMEKSERRTMLCESCTSGTEGSAWMRVSTLRDEKRALEMRVEELEGTVTGCLDIVAAMGV